MLFRLVRKFCENFEIKKIARDAFLGTTRWNKGDKNRKKDVMIIEMFIWKLGSYVLKMQMPLHNHQGQFLPLLFSVFTSKHTVPSIRPSQPKLGTVLPDAFASLLVVIVVFLYIFDLFWILCIHLFMLTAYIGGTISGQGLTWYHICG